MVIFAMLGTMMFCSKVAMEALPNIHLVGMLTIVYTIVFRVRALIPVYIYVMLNGVFAGFNIWWIPYLYIWAILCGMTLLVPKNIPKKFAYIIYPVICALHGILFGALYAPAQALMYGMDFKKMIAWIIAGLPFDILHCGGNFAVGLLIVPLADTLEKLVKKH